MKDYVHSFCTALRFLTVLPIPWFADRDSELQKECVKTFAVVGLVIGSCGYVLTKLLIDTIPAPLLCSLLLFYLSAISGFLHLDGFADTADGFLSYRPQEQKLSIMRDSRTGAMGVILLIFLLLFKFTALLSLPSQYLAVAVFLMPLGGRSAIVLLMALLPYARQEGGLGKLYYLQEKIRIPAVTLLICFIFTAIAQPFLVPIVFSALLISTLFFGYWCKKAIGGTTGDTLGAVCEISEATTAIFLAVYLHN